jgi:hypothetical protein
MEVSYIVLSLLAIGLLIYCGMTLNSYSVEKYDYKPINLLNMFLIAYIGVFGQQCQSSTGHFCNEIF